MSTKKRLQISESFSLPIDLVTSTQAILARKRSGKSYLAGVEVEEMLEQGAQIAIIDPTAAWWGLKSSADGKSAGYPIVIFGGRNADAPLDFRAGKAMATAFLERGFSAVFDIKAFTLTEQQTFVMEFCDEILRVNTHALHLVIDEADTFAPQTPRSKPASACLGTVSRLISQGGLGGTGVTMISQRSQKMNWDALSQIDSLTVLRMSAPLDIKPVVAWIDANASTDFAEEVKNALPKLPVGTAFIASGQLDLAERIEVRRKRTFDSSATPKPGERKIVPKKFAQVDAKQLGEQIAASIAEAKANSPDELKARIRELERQLAKPAAHVVVPKQVIDPQLKQENTELKTRLADVRKKAERLHLFVDSQVWPMLEKLKSGIVDIDIAMGVIRSATDHTVSIDTQRRVVPVTPTPAARVILTQPTRAAGPEPVGDRKLGGVALKIAAIAAGYGEQGLNKKLLATLAGSTIGGTFSARISEARLAGAITTDGGMVRATPEGVATYAGAFRVPQTTEDVLALWRPRLGGVALSIFDYLVSLGGEFITRADLAAAVGASVGGTFSARLSEARSTQLLVERDNKVAVNRELLFM